jgi:hypothetical protein
MPPEAISAEGEGINEIRDRIPVLARIVVRYVLVVPQGVRDKVERALASHVDKCPTAQSLKGAVEIEWTADIREAPEPE